MHYSKTEWQDYCGVMAASVLADFDQAPAMYLLNKLIDAAHDLCGKETLALQKVSITNV